VASPYASPLEAKGRTLLNDEVAKLPALRQALAAMKTNAPDANVVVRGAAGVDYQNVISVLDILQQLDITKVGLATETAP
jgi:biopolymer transport protein ExbD